MKKIVLHCLLTVGCSLWAVDKTSLYRSRDEFELAVAWSNPEALDAFLHNNSADVVRSILNEPMEFSSSDVRPPAFFQLVTSAYIAENEVASIQMLRSAIEFGADLHNRYVNSRAGGIGLFRTITPFELAVYLALITGKTAIVQLLCEYGAHGDDSHEIINVLYEEVVRMHEEQYDEVDEQELKIVDAEEKQRMMDQFAAVRDELHAIINNC